MKFFHLPDLGEGIPEADIVSWNVKAGDAVKEDQIIASVETAKAIVEIPSPITGIIASLCGQVGDTILTGEPLIEFICDNDNEDTGTVVGELAKNIMQSTEDDSFIIGAPLSPSVAQSEISETSLSALAKQYHIKRPVSSTGQNETKHLCYHLDHPEPLKGVRRHMARIMAQSHACVVPATLFDDVNISQWAKNTDITVRLIQSMIAACQEEPALNAWFDGSTMSQQRHKNINLGLAIDSQGELFVPVITQAQDLSAIALRNEITLLCQEIADRSINPKKLQGATINLSNFGVFAGSYATPIIVPPTVCILGVGRIHHIFTNSKNKPTMQPMLPLSLSFDHRAVTGGEAARFLRTIIRQLTEK